MVRPLNSRHPWLLVFVALAAITIALPAAAQGIVKGTVKDDKGQPVDGAKVTIEGAARKFETTTDKKGEFVQIGLASGPYKVTAEKDKVGAMTRNVTVRQGAPQIADFVLSTNAGFSKEAIAKNDELK